MGIVIPESQLVKPHEKKRGIQLGQIEKLNPWWIAALGFANLPVAVRKPDGTKTNKVDGDLWVVGVDDAPRPEAVDIVFYDPEDPTRAVTSSTGAYEYLGDARDGDEIEGDDEQTRINHKICRDNGIAKNFILGHIYDPPGVDWSQIPQSYLRIFPEGVSDREGNILVPSKADAVKAVKLTEVGSGAKCVLLGVDEWTGPGPLDWTFTLSPSRVPSLREFLTKLGVGLPEGWPA